MPEMCSMTNKCAIKVINYHVMSSNNKKNTYKWRTRKFEMFLFIICEDASHFTYVRKF